MSFEDKEHEPQDAELIIQATLGDNIERALMDRTSPFSKMMAGARDNYVEGLSALVDIDLNTTEGIAEAKRLQAHCVRYRDMCAWINIALQEAGAADEKLDDREEESDEPEIQKLKDQMNGTRDKPAPDA